MNLQQHRLAITPLSPVHMGTNADYELTGYVIDDGALFEFDSLAALKALPEAERNRLNGILSGKPTEQMLREVQGFFFANRERLIAYSRRQVRVNKTVEAFYKDRVGRVVQHEHGGRKVQNRLEIERSAWNPVNGRPILPGSGLKGAIRTALLDMVNDGRRPERNERNRDLQNRLFGYRAGKFELDPMRLVRLGDAPLVEEAQIPTEVFFALNRKKRPVEKNGALVQSKAEQQNLYQLLECVPALHPQAFVGGLVIDDPDGVGEKGRTVPSRCFAVADIAGACNRFYRPILDAELRLLRQRGFIDGQWADQAGDLLARLQPAFDASRAFLLRVGRHSGAESVTLNGVRSIKIMKGKGEKPDYLDSAKTLWLAGHERQAQTGLLPFGWLVVEIDPEDAGAWSGISSAKQDAHWLEQIQQRCQALRDRVEAERSQQEQRARQAAEEERQRAAEAEAFEKLGPEEKAIERVRQVYLSERQNRTLAANSQTAELRIKLLRQAAEWPRELRIRAADLIDQVTADLPWSKKARKQGIPEQVEALRNE